MEIELVGQAQANGVHVTVDVDALGTGATAGPAGGIVYGCLAVIREPVFQLEGQPVADLLLDTEPEEIAIEILFPEAVPEVDGGPRVYGGRIPKRAAGSGKAEARTDGQVSSYTSLTCCTGAGNVKEASSSPNV